MAFQEIIQRLKKLVEYREFVFRNTERELADQYLSELMEFKGVSESERIKLEMECRGNFSREFKEYLKLMGLKHGRLFYGSQTCPRDYSQQDLKNRAQELLSENDVDTELDYSDFVFVYEEGFSFHLIKAQRERDLGVYYFEEGEEEIVQVAGSFGDFLESEVSRMEKRNAEFIASGGYILTLEEGGGMSMIFDGGEENPLSKGDEFI